MFEWYVLNYNSNKNSVEQFNIFDNWLLDEEVQRQVKKYLHSPNKYKFKRYNTEPIYGFDGLCEEIRRCIMWQEWGRCEYEIAVGDLWIEELYEIVNKVDNGKLKENEVYEYIKNKSKRNKKLEKWDCYMQCEKNIRAITRECIYQYKKYIKENK